MAEPAERLPIEPRDAPAGEQDHVIVLDGAGWADFRRLLAIRGDRSVPRLAYSDGKLELMSPSRFRESIKSNIGRLVEAWCMERGVDITPYGGWTLDDAAAQRGLEPDECYVLGDVENPDRPDLAIEVVWTSGRIDKLPIYRALRVREVWVWKRGRIAIHVLRDDGYEPAAHSTVLPGLDLALLTRFIDTRPTTRAVREFLALLRAHSDE